MGNGPSHGLSCQAKTYLAWRAFGTEGIWHRGHLAQRANDMEGIWTEGIWSEGIFLRAFGKRAFGRGHLVGGQVTPNRISVGGNGREKMAGG